MSDDVHTALERLRELSSTIYPSLLLDLGLAEALRAAASAGGAPGRLDVNGLERHTPEVEGAVYFCCADALLHGATVRVWDEPGAVQFDIVGSDVAELSDRVRALGGRVTSSGAHASVAIPVAP